MPAAGLGGGGVRGGEEAGAAKEARREGPAGCGGREAGPARGCNYNRVEVRGAGPETTECSPTSRAGGPPITPSDDPPLSPSRLVTPVGGPGMGNFRH